MAGASAVTATSFLIQPSQGQTPALSAAFVAQFMLPFGVALVLCLRLIRHPRLDRRTRRSWLLFGLAMAFCFAGGLFDMVAGSDPSAPVTLSTVLYIAYYAAVFAGLLCLPMRRATRRQRVRMGLDLLLVAVSLAMISWYVVVGPLLRAGAPDRASMIVMLAYSVGDLVLALGLIILLMRTVLETSRRPLWIMAVAIATIALSDTAATVARLHQISAIDFWLAAVYAAAPLVIAAAAQAQYTCGWRAGQTEQAARTDVKASRLPYVAVGLAYAVLLVAGRDLPLYPMGGLILGAVALTVTVLARQLTVVHDNRVLALTDGLTGLANRTLLYARLTASLNTARRTGSHVGILLIDLNKFKPINDCFGHEAGDALLVAVGQRLRRAVRPSDIAARLGGDEFAVLINELTNPDTIMGIAERVLSQLCGPVVYQEHLLEIAASIGVAASNPDTVTAEDLIHRADAAMYAAKRTGTNTYCLFTTDLIEQDPRRELQQAIDRNELVLHYQPIVDLATGDPIALEALVRWQHPTRGLLPPADFIPQAEQNGLIVALGAWVLDRTCAQLREWRDTLTGGAGPTLSVNVSANQVSRPSFVAEVTATLDRHGVNPADIILELAEDTNPVARDEVRAVIDALRGLGVRIAVDGFGTGCATLSSLRQVPIDILKVDRSFVSGIAEDDDSRTIVEAIVRLGRALKLDVVAEGIETRDQQEALEQMSCTHGQGYLYARPEDATTTTALLAQTRQPVLRTMTRAAGDNHDGVDPPGRRERPAG